MLYYDEPHEFRAKNSRSPRPSPSMLGLRPNGGTRRLALQDSEERFRATFFQAAVGITQANLSGQFRLVNDRFCEILGYSRAEVLGMTFLEITHPDHREACLHAIQRLVNGEIASYSTEKRFLRRERRHGLGAGECVPGAGPEPPAAILHRRGGRQHRTDTGGARTSRKRAAPDARAKRGAPGRVGLRSAGKVDHIIAPGHAELGDPRTFAEWFALIHPEDKKRLLALAAESVVEKQNWETEFRVVLSDGSSAGCSRKPRYSSTTLARRLAWLESASILPSVNRPKPHYAKAKSSSVIWRTRRR